ANSDTLRDGRTVAAGLEKIQFLRPRASLSDFLAQTRKIFSQLSWKERWNEVERLSRGWNSHLGGTFSRNTFLRWLREVLGAPSLRRDDFGAHPYARVHLVPYSEAQGQPWS